MRTRAWRMAGMAAVAIGCGGATAAGAGTPAAASAPAPVSVPTSAPVRATATSVGGTSGAAPSVAPMPRLEPCPAPTAAPRWSVIRLAEYLPRDRSRADVEQALLGKARLAIVERDLGISVSGVTSRIVGEEGVGANSQLTDIFLQQFRQEVGGRVVEECARFVDVGRDSMAIEFSAVVARETEDASAGRALTASPPRVPSPEPSPVPSPVPSPSLQKSPAVEDQPQVLVPLPGLNLKDSPTGNVVHGAVAIEPPTTTTTTSAGGPSPLRTKLKEAFEALSNSRSALIKGFDPTSWILNHLKRPTERIIASTEPPAVLPTSMTTREGNILPPPSPPVNQNKRKATDEELSATRTPNNEDAERPTGKRPKHEIISKGPFFRSKTWVQMNGRPKYDSDDEDTVEARCVEAKRFLNEFIDFSQDELDFMAEWNDVAIKFNVLADYEAPALCEAFVRENGDRLREDDLFHRHFVETIINLFENGVIHKREVTEILALTKRDEPLEKWSDRVDTRGGNKRRCTLVAMKEFPQPARDTLATARYLT